MGPAIDILIGVGAGALTLFVIQEIVKNIKIAETEMRTERQRRRHRELECSANNQLDQARRCLQCKYVRIATDADKSAAHP